MSLRVMRVLENQKCMRKKEKENMSIISMKGNTGMRWKLIVYWVTTAAVAGEQLAGGVTAMAPSYWQQQNKRRWLVAVSRRSLIPIAFKRLSFILREDIRFAAWSLSIPSAISTWS